ncbi:zonadhesin-like [Plutella xylostella]|uniref:zonadhesin-like n=1 Tax=Plutella xylostella TaxID=51655 RepID=UPI002032B5B2|nr:zonadhesin-like [Plutella xylostella]
MGCFCKAGYVRDEKSNKCVTLDQCPVDLIADPSEKQIAILKTFLVYQKSQVIPNLHPSSNSPLTFSIFPEQCLNSNETYAICTASCQPTCSDPEPLCLQVCSSGCVCNEGLLRDDSGVCVRAEQCPPSNSTDAGLVGKYYDVINKILHLSTA